jgi:hypothetical protein
MDALLFKLLGDTPPEPQKKTDFLFEEDKAEVCFNKQNKRYIKDACILNAEFLPQA